MYRDRAPESPQYTQYPQPRDPAALLEAQLANAEADRIDALEEAEVASERTESYRAELQRLRAQLREAQAALAAAQQRIEKLVFHHDRWRQYAVNYAFKLQDLRACACRRRCPIRSRPGGQDARAG